VYQSPYNGLLLCGFNVPIEVLSINQSRIFKVAQVRIYCKVHNSDDDDDDGAGDNVCKSLIMLLTA